MPNDFESDMFLSGSAKHIAQQTIERARQDRSTSLNLSARGLGARSDKLDEIPPEVFDLQQLEYLALNGNNIRTVPERIRELTKLKHLSLIGNPIESVPDIGGLAIDWETYQRCRKILLKAKYQGNLDNTRERKAAKP